MFSAIKQAIFILFCAVVLAGLVNFIRPDGIPWIGRKTAPETITAAGTTLPTISLEDALEALHSEKAIFVDARNPENYNEAHIPGAINVPPDQFDENAESFMNTIPPDREVILYCDGPGCHLAETLGQLMLEVGYENIALFFEGWEGWQEKGLPTTSGGAESS